MYKWEEGLIALGLELVKRVGERQVLVRMDGFEFLTYKSNLSRRVIPTIMTCTDKTGYFLHKYGDKLTDKLDYSKLVYVGCEQPVTVTCPVHGDIQMIPEVLSRGNGCNACGNRRIGIKQTSTHEYNLKRAREVHGDKYEYGFLGVPSKIKVEITCPYHGVFMQNFSNHVGGRKGCPDCAREDHPVFNRTSFAKYSTFYLYVMRMWNEDSGEDFIKIGISHNPQSRCRQFNNKSGGAYSAEVLYTHQTDGVGAWDLENLLHREFREFSYTPTHRFGGSTECFSSVCLDSVKKIAQCCS